MNSSVTKSATKQGNVLGSGQNKKSRRKKGRNKNRNFNSRKKRFKKFSLTNEANSFISKFNTKCERNMSNWYWSNYKKAVEWQDRRKVAHWKTYALALYEENRYLRQIIKNILPELVPDVPITQSNLTKVNHYNKQKFKGNLVHFINGSNAGNKTHNLPVYEEEVEEEQKIIGDGKDDDDDDNDSDDDDDDGEDDDDDDDNNDDDDDDDNDDVELEMSEEMIQFFEQSYKHKMDLQKLKEEELIKSREQEIKEIQINKMKRSTEMTLLYGEGAAMITGMETAIQLSFDKYCDMKSPQYWPNIPFRL